MLLEVSSRGCRSAGNDEHCAAASSHEPSQIVRIAGQYPVPGGSDGRNGGINCIARPGTAQQDPCLTTEVSVNRLDVHGPQEASQVRLPTSGVAPHLGNDHARRTELDTVLLCHSQLGDHLTVISIDC